MAMTSMSPSAVPSNAIRPLRPEMRHRRLARRGPAPLSLQGVEVRVLSWRALLGRPTRQLEHSLRAGQGPVRRTGKPGSRGRGDPPGSRQYCGDVANWDDVRRIALELPETSERVHLHQWRVKDKLFKGERLLRRADFEALGDTAPEGPISSARVEHLGAKEALLANDQGVFFHDTALRRHRDPRLARSTSAEILEEVIVEAWLVRRRRGSRRRVDGRCDHHLWPDVPVSREVVSDGQSPDPGSPGYGNQRLEQAQYVRRPLPRSPPQSRLALTCALIGQRGGNGPARTSIVIRGEAHARPPPRCTRTHERIWRCVSWWTQVPHRWGAGDVSFSVSTLSSQRGRFRASLPREGEDLVRRARDEH